MNSEKIHKLVGIGLEYVTLIRVIKTGINFCIWNLFFGISDTDSVCAQNMFRNEE